MATKRRKLSARPIGISAAAIEAWRAGDFWTLHRALDLKVWQMPHWNSDPPEPRPTGDWPPVLRAWEHLLDCKAQLVELAGPPPRRWHYR